MTRYPAAALCLFSAPDVLQRVTAEDAEAGLPLELVRAHQHTWLKLVSDMLE